MSTCQRCQVITLEIVISMQKTFKSKFEQCVLGENSRCALIQLIFEVFSNVKGINGVISQKEKKKMADVSIF